MTPVRIERIAAGGDGVGRLDDGMAVFVPRTAPGDEVEIALMARKARYARGRALRIAAPGPARVTPRCPHFEADGCGGCQLQHLSLDAQLAAKGAIVRETLRRIGRLDVGTVEVVPAPAPWRYRTKITLAIGKEGRVGLHPWDRPGDVFALDDCLIATGSLMALWTRLRPHLALLPAGLTHLVLREDRTGSAHVLVRGGRPPWDAVPLATALDGAATAVWWEPDRGAARVVSGARTGFPATAFAQIQPCVADRIRADAAGALGEVADRVVWDLYGGAGDGARNLAGRGARVWSVDASRASVDWAERQPAPEGAPDGSPAFLCARVEEALHRLPAPDAVLLNPPRAGAGDRVIRALDRLGRRGRARRLAYISCDPATLARDLGALQGYAVTLVRAYDLFPQTSHVETLAVLEAA